jgi:hypothetical protein
LQGFQDHNKPNFSKQLIHYRFFFLLSKFELIFKETIYL